MKHLLVGIDGSDGGDAAVEEALALAPDLRAMLTFVCVRNAVSRRLEGPFYERSLQQGRERARNVVEHAMELAEEAGIEADGEILDGDPADEIVSLADNRGSDLIVVGSRAHGPLAGALLGSVAIAVVQHAKSPVLVAKQAPTRNGQVA